MKFRPVDPPRAFRPTGPDGPQISHVATVELDLDEQITVVSDNGAEIDIVRKEWGFYPLPSLNGRLARFELYPVLVASPEGKTYLLVVENGKRPEFEAYIASEGMMVVAWLGDKTPE